MKTKKKYKKKQTNRIATERLFWHKQLQSIYFMQFRNYIQTYFNECVYNPVSSTGFYTEFLKCNS